MIKQLRVKNFKSLRDTGSLDLRPLTLFIGPNSSGKSSVLHSLLLLKQTIDSRDTKNRLLINGGHLTLGSYPEIIFGHNTRRSLSIEFTFSASKVPPESFVSDFFPEAGSIKFSAKFSWNDRASEIFLANAQYKLAPVPVSFTISRTRGDNYKAELMRAGIQKPRTYDVVPVKFYGVEVLPHQIDVRDYRAEDILIPHHLPDSLENAFRHLFYIGPLRDVPKRLYIASGETPEDVGFRGESAVDLLWREGKRGGKGNGLLRKVSGWMKRFAVASDVGLESKLPDHYSLILVNPETRLPINIAHNGFGASQILPIIVEGFHAPKGSLLLMEQPEIHLHPKAQAELGDLLIEIAGEKKTVIVETHSWQLISRIQRRIAENQSKSSAKVRAEDVALYYFSMTKNGTKIRRIKIRENGQFAPKGLPEGFFGEEHEERTAHFRAMVRNARKR